MLTSRVKYWAPVIAWMLLIFAASGDLMSAEHTSRFLAPFLRWIVPGISPATVGLIQLFIRKCAHVAEYGVLAALLWRAFAQSQRGSGRAAATAFITAVVYAALDEFHQSFVPARTGTPQDVVIDSCGALFGLAVCALAGFPKSGFRNPR